MALNADQQALLNNIMTYLDTVMGDGGGGLGPLENFSTLDADQKQKVKEYLGYLIYSFLEKCNTSTKFKFMGGVQGVTGNIEIPTPAGVAVLEVQDGIIYGVSGSALLT